jgi:transcriptional regulator with XRE-family HTH domain
MRGHLVGDTPDREKHLSFPERLRRRREELRLTREALKERIEEMGTPISLSIIRDMEKQGEHCYRLPKRRSNSPNPIVALAEALDVELGYLLGGFSREELEASSFGQLYRDHKIAITDSLAPKDKEPFADFLASLPTKESEILSLPLSSFRNERAFAIIHRIERIYAGLEMLIINDPPLIFWDDDDVRGWGDKMKLTQGDATDFRAEFRRYRQHFRSLVKNGKKAYKIVLNQATFCTFLRHKFPDNRAKQIDDIIDFLGFPNFNLVLLKPKESPSYALRSDEMDEAEVISKHLRVPTSLEGTLSVQILQTPVYGDTPVEYFVTPAPPNRFLLQREKARIEEAWARALDQYETDYQKFISAGKELNEKSQKEITRTILLAIKHDMRG